MVVSVTERLKASARTPDCTRSAAMDALKKGVKQLSAAVSNANRSKFSGEGRALGSAPEQERNFAARTHMRLCKLECFTLIDCLIWSAEA